MRRPVATVFWLIGTTTVTFGQPGAKQEDGLRFPAGGRIVACVEAPHTCAERAFASSDDVLPWIRSLPANSSRYAVRVTFDSGTHEIMQPWIVDGNRLPPSIARIEIVGSDSPRTRFVGSRRLQQLTTPRTARRAGVLSFALTTTAVRATTFEGIGPNTPGPPVLFDALGSMPYAAWPREGFADFAGGIVQARGAAFVPADSDRVVRWRDETSAWVLGQFRYEWYFEHRRLASTSIAARQATVAGPPDYGIAPTGKFRILNALSELDEPREFHIDYRRGEISIHPDAGPSLASLRIALQTEPLLVIKNLSRAKLARLNFGETRGDGVVVEGCNSTELADLDIRDVGRSAIVVRGGAQVTVANATIDNTGTYGILLDGGDRATLRSGRHEIVHSLVTRPGQWVLTPSASIRLLGVGQVVRDTTLLDAPQSAIYFDGNDHRIERNRIERVCRVATDCGAVYAGRDWTFRGNVLRGNTIANLVPAVPGRTVAAIYLDDMLSGTRVIGNLVLASPYGVLVGGGRDNIVTNNLFVDSAVPIHVDDRALDWASRAVAPGEVMRQRLAAMPVRDSTWSAAYPELAAMAIDRAAWPDGNQVVSNACSQCGIAELMPRAAQASRLEQPIKLDVAGMRSSAESIMRRCAVSGRCGGYRPPSQ
jgi:Right handed beta helix region